jgi:hypothetical protein
MLEISHSCRKRRVHCGFRQIDLAGPCLLLLPSHGSRTNLQALEFCEINTTFIDDDFAVLPHAKTSASRGAFIQTKKKKKTI